MHDAQTSSGRRHIATLLAGVLLAAMLSAVPPATASATLRVPQDHPTVQAAINAASPGDTIVVAPGTYTESITIDRSIALVAQTYDAANPRNNTSILAAPDGLTTIASTKGISPAPSVTGFVIRDGYDGIRVRSPMVITANRLVGNIDSLQYGNGGGGVVSGNVIDPGQDDGIDLNHPVRDLTIEGNEIVQASGDAIELRLDDDTIQSTVDIVIRDNRIVDAAHDGIQLIDMFQDTNRVIVIEGNLIEGSVQAGLGMLDNGESGEDYRAASIRERIHVFHNTFVDNDHGISGGDNVIALNNIFQGHQLALKNVDTDSIAAYNLFWDNLVDQQGSVVDAPTTISADPLLDANDRLGPGSPAIDAGTAFFEWQGEVVMDQPPSSYEGASPDLGWLESGGAPNQPPTIDAVDVAPASPTTIDVLTAVVDATDPDGDALTYTYQWRLNGQDLAGATSQSLDLAQAGNGNRGDALGVRVVASDGAASSPAVTSSAVTVVNAAPLFGQDLGDRISVEGSAVSLSAGASDPDGDAVSFEATGLPPGLAIDGGTGLISGTIAAGAAAGGPYAVVVTARDPSGAEATDTFTWTVVVSLPVTVTVKDFKFVPKGVTAALGQVVRWTFQGPSIHTATDSIGLGVGTAPLFDSGPRGPGATYEFAFGAAGNYPYGSTLHPMTGTVRVPVTVSPSSGTTATQFTLQWATASMTGYHFSVQYRFRPQGSGTWGKWGSLGAAQTAPSGAFVPDQGAGSYEFRSRLQNDATGRMSSFSVATSITVS